MVKLIATFGNDYAIELAEEKLKKAGFMFKRERPIKLIIEAKTSKDVEIVKQIIKQSYGYLEPIEDLKSKIISLLTAGIKYIIMPKKKE
jgi:hypothetical protein